MDEGEGEDYDGEDLPKIIPEIHRLKDTDNSLIRD